MARFCFVYPEYEGDAPQMVGTKTVNHEEERPRDSAGAELSKGDCVRLVLVDKTLW